MSESYTCLLFFNYEAKHGASVKDLIIMRNIRFMSISMLMLSSVTGIIQHNFYDKLVAKYNYI